MCMWDNMVECTKGILLWVRSVFNIWVGLWSSKSVYSVCVMLCLGSVHELRKWDLASAELYMSMYLEAAGCELWWLAMYLELY